MENLLTEIKAQEFFVLDLLLIAILTICINVIFGHEQVV